MAARAILLDEEGRVLLGKRAKGIETGKWCLIGGKPEGNETMEEAVKRETKEEASIDFEPVFYRKIGGVDKDKDIKWLSSYFVGHIKSNEVSDNYEEGELAELKFFSPEELVDLEIAFDHKSVLIEFFLSRSSPKGKKFSQKKKSQNSTREPNRASI